MHISYLLIQNPAKFGGRCFDLRSISIRNAKVFELSTPIDLFSSNLAASISSVTKNSFHLDMSVHCTQKKTPFYAYILLSFENSSYILFWSAFS